MTPHTAANWSYPTEIRFGAGRIGELGEACRAAGMVRPLLVTDPGLAELAMTDSALATCRAGGLEVGLYSDVRGNPTMANVAAGIQAFHGRNHDGVIAFGGGSALDCGKVIAFQQGQSRPLDDFEDVGDNWARADAAGIAPVVAVPTTAGTGSEVGRAGLITDEAGPRKLIIFHPGMLAKTVILDPELSIGLPPALTAATGIDALSHCLEAYCAPHDHPMSAGIAVEGMRLIREHLPIAYADGGNLEARGRMLIAAAMGATAFQRGLGLMHALAHPIGALFNAHHGLINAVLMPYVLKHNRPAIEDRIARLAAYLGLAEPGFQGFHGDILRLRQELAIPHTLAEIGVDARESGRIAAMAVDDPSAGGNPIPVTVNSAGAVLDDAFTGDAGL